MSLPDRPPILNPRIVPVLGRDVHLPPVTPERLTVPALRERFAAPPACPFAGAAPVGPF